jgi:hypothetical protein
VFTCMPQVNDFEAAAGILDTMQAEGLRPSAITICALLNSFWKRGRGNEVRCCVVHSELLSVSVRVESSCFRWLVQLTVFGLPLVLQDLFREGFRIVLATAYLWVGLTILLLPGIGVLRVVGVEGRAPGSEGLRHRYGHALRHGPHG